MASPERSVRVSAVDDCLIHALAEHCPPTAGWGVSALDVPVAPDALVIVDFGDGDAQRRAVNSARAMGFAGHILILGGQDTGLSADEEVLVRPARLGALLSRIDLHWLRMQETSAGRLGPYEFIPDESILRPPSGTGLIRLTERECKLLVYLTEARGALVSREQLLAAVWGYAAGIDTHTVETHIWRLRQKIETDDPGTRFLLTETGGYRLLLDAAQDGDTDTDLMPQG